MEIDLRVPHMPAARQQIRRVALAFISASKHTAKSTVRSFALSISLCTLSYTHSHSGELMGIQYRQREGARVWLLQEIYFVGR